MQINSAINNQLVGFLDLNWTGSLSDGETLQHAIGCTIYEKKLEHGFEVERVFWLGIDRSKRSERCCTFIYLAEIDIGISEWWMVNEENGWSSYLNTWWS